VIPRGSVSPALGRFVATLSARLKPEATTV
jgi:hypothetical protein